MKHTSVFSDEAYQIAHVLVGRAQPQALRQHERKMLLHVAMQQGVWANVAQNLLGWPVPDMGEDERKALKAGVRSTTMKQLWYAAKMQQVDRVLTAHGIQAIWVKGLMISEIVYPKPKLRSMADIDVLVPFAQRYKALEVLQHIGYVLRDTQERIAFAQDKNPHNQGIEFVLSLAEGNQVSYLDLHYHLLKNRNDYLSTEQLAKMRQQVHMVKVRGQVYRTFIPELHLLYIAAHAVLQTGIHMTQVRHYYDLHCMLRNLGLDHALVVRWASELQWGSALDQALAIVDDLFATPEARPLRNALDGVHDDIHREHIQMMADESIYFSRIARELQNVTWRERLRIVRQVLAPSKQYMRRRYGVAHWPQLLLAYPRYWVMSLYKYGRSFFRYLIKRYAGR